MDFMHQTVASTIVKYFTWLFDNDGIINGHHFYISLNLCVLFYAIYNMVTEIIKHDSTIFQAIVTFFITGFIYMITIFPLFYIVFICIAWK